MNPNVVCPSGLVAVGSTTVVRGLGRAPTANVVIPVATPSVSSWTWPVLWNIGCWAGGTCDGPCHACGCLDSRPATVSVGLAVTSSPNPLTITVPTALDEPVVDVCSHGTSVLSTVAGLSSVVSA